MTVAGDTGTVTMASSGMPGDSAAPGVSGGIDTLSPRELDVLRLLASGMPNKEIAARLNLAPRTAANHVAAVLAKLGVQSRAAAAAFAVRHGLA